MGSQVTGCGEPFETETGTRFETARQKKTGMKTRTGTSKPFWAKIGARSELMREGEAEMEIETGSGEPFEAETGTRFEIARGKLKHRLDPVSPLRLR